ncbi:DUF6418 domain-containing protein [Actinobacillus porcinus]|uniref:DUF6418 domain-containing protein n=1 Tax=Actinobacillus porcinus TaxID=51048 RepID=UPI002356B79C|nr:DUF6418 domain-containing protein [Actinobacillus porcinus]
MIRIILLILTIFSAGISFICIGYDTVTSLFFLLFVFLVLSLFYSGNKIAFFLLIQFLVAFLWCSCSLYYIEYGNFISEQNKFGENVGALIRYIFYMGIFLLFAYFVISYKTKNIKGKLDVGGFLFFKQITYLLFFILVILCFFIGMVYGIPLFSGVSRFEFYRLIEPLDKVIFMMPISAFMLGVVFSQSNTRYSFYGALVLILFLILFSDKFSGIYGVLIYFIIGFYLSKNIVNNTSSYGFNKKVLYLYFPSIMFILISIVSIGYIYLHGASSSDLMERILSRALGLQAHVWYGIDFQLWHSLLLPDSSIFLLESNEPVQPAGLEYLMYQVADEKFVDSFREAGIRFTNGYPAIVLISFGYAYSITILALLGCILGIFLYYIYQKVRLLQPLRLIIALIFYNNILINIFIMGEIYYIYKLLGVVCFIIILIDVCVCRHKNFRVLGFNKISNKLII